MRSATDIAAKAAANTLSETQDLQAARAAAVAIASSNNVAGKPLSLDTSDLQFGSASRQQDGSYTFVLGGTPINAVQVTGRRTAESIDGPVDSWFGRFYGHEQYQPEITSFAAFLDTDICLVLDRSGSMKTPVIQGDTYDPNYYNLPPAPNSRWSALNDAVTLFL